MNGRTIILAGGSGGLGAVLADFLTERGARPVLGCFRNTDRAVNVAADIESRHGVSIPVVTGDVLEEKARARLLDQASSLGALYGLVLLIGEPARVPIEEATEEDLLAATRINFVAPVLLARDFASRTGTTDASIVFVSTMQAVGVFPGSLTYAAPKAGLIHAARILAHQWGGGAHRIRVNVVAPGVTTSGMAEKSVASGKYDPYIERGVISRFGDPLDVARAIGLFLEPDNYLTGQVLTVDGGQKWPPKFGQHYKVDSA